MEDYGKILLDNFLPVVLLILAPVAIYYVNRFLAYLEKEHNFKLTQEQRALLNQAIDNSIAYIEEQGHKACKTDKKLESEKKLDDGASYAVSEIKRLGLPEIASEEIKKLIEARLPAFRATKP